MSYKGWSRHLSAGQNDSKARVPTTVILVSLDTKETALHPNVKLNLLRNIHMARDLSRTKRIASVPLREFQLNTQRLVSLVSLIHGGLLNSSHMWAFSLQL